MARYRKLPTTIWTRPEFKELSERAKVLYLYIRTCPHNHMAGIAYIPIVLASFEVKIPPADVESCMGELVNSELVKWDKSASVIWVIGMLADEGKGSKVWQAVAHHLGSLPDSEIIQEFLSVHHRVRELFEAPPKKSRLKVPQGLRYEIIERDNSTCVYCGRKPPEVSLEVDHVLAVSNGGTNDPENLVTACYDCNAGKGAHQGDRQGAQHPPTPVPTPVPTQGVLEALVPPKPKKVQPTITHALCEQIRSEWYDVCVKAGLPGFELTPALARSLKARILATKNLRTAGAWRKMFSGITEIDHYMGRTSGEWTISFRWMIATDEKLDEVYQKTISRGTNRKSEGPPPGYSD